MYEEKLKMVKGSEKKSVVARRFNVFPSNVLILLISWRWKMLTSAMLNDDLKFILRIILVHIRYRNP